MLDKKLAAAADNGMAALKQEWRGLPSKAKSVLKAALDRRHKVRAREVDAPRSPA